MGGAEGSGVVRSWVSGDEEAGAVEEGEGVCDGECVASGWTTE